MGIGRKVLLFLALAEYITVLVHLHNHYYSKHRAAQTCPLQVLVPVEATVCMYKYVSGRQAGTGVKFLCKCMMGYKWATAGTLGN